MTPKPYQIYFADKLFNIFKQKGYVYLQGEPRSGKTYTAILLAEKCNTKKPILVLTKKNAITGWYKFLNNNLLLKHKYYVTNYEAIGNIKDKKIQLKLNANDYNIVICDESHVLGKVGVPNNRIKLVKALCKNMFHIHLSATAIVETPAAIYNQMNISKYTPFGDLNSFKTFAMLFIIIKNKYIAGRVILDYSTGKQKLFDLINSFTVYMTQDDAGIKDDLKAVDKIHYIELDSKTKKLYNTLLKDRILEIDEKYTLIADSVMKLRVSLHMLECGIANVLDKEYITKSIFLGNIEKITYIKKLFGDTGDLGIMSHFVAERELLKVHFKEAKIYSSSAHAEGVDLSYLKYFVIISSDYSGAKFIQRRERIVNINGSNTVEVHHILVKNAISEQVYKLVSKKRDFNNQQFNKNNL